jgi:hypothetical protein
MVVVPLALVVGVAVAWRTRGNRSAGVARDALVAGDADVPSLARLDGDLAAYACLVVAVGGAAMMTFFYVTRWPPSLWYYLPLLSVTAIAAGCIVDTALATCARRRAKVGLVVLCLALAAPAIEPRLQIRLSNIDRIAKVIEAREKPGDLVVIQPFVDAIPFGRYYRGTSRWTSAPPVEDVSLHRWDLVIASARSAAAMDPLLDDVRRTLGEGHRVWLVTRVRWTEVRRRPPRPEPLSGTKPRLGFYFQRWSQQLFYELQADESRMEKIRIPSDQPVSPYERDELLVVSGRAGA